jgi:hypothetical protein
VVRDASNCTLSDDSEIDEHQGSAVTFEEDPFPRVLFVAVVAMTGLEGEGEGGGAAVVVVNIIDNVVYSTGIGIADAVCPSSIGAVTFTFALSFSRSLLTSDCEYVFLLVVMFLCSRKLIMLNTHH